MARLSKKRRRDIKEEKQQRKLQQQEASRLEELKARRPSRLQRVAHDRVNRTKFGPPSVAALGPTSPTFLPSRPAGTDLLGGYSNPLLSADVQSKLRNYAPPMGAPVQTPSIDELISAAGKPIPPMQHMHLQNPPPAIYPQPAKPIVPGPLSGKGISFPDPLPDLPAPKPTLERMFSNTAIDVYNQNQQTIRGRLFNVVAAPSRLKQAASATPEALSKARENLQGLITKTEESGNAFSRGFNSWRLGRAEAKYSLLKKGELSLAQSSRFLARHGITKAAGFVAKGAGKIGLGIARGLMTKPGIALAATAAFGYGALSGIADNVSNTDPYSGRAAEFFSEDVGGLTGLAGLYIAGSRAPGSNPADNMDAFAMQQGHASQPTMSFGGGGRRSKDYMMGASGDLALSLSKLRRGR